MIAPNRQKEFETFIIRNNITSSVILDDVEVTLEEERQSMAKNRMGRMRFDPAFPDFSIYWTYEEMHTYSSYLASTYPNIVNMQTIATTPGGRVVYVLRISSGVFGQKPIIAMEGDVIYFHKLARLNIIQL